MRNLQLATSIQEKCNLLPITGVSDSCGIILPIVENGLNVFLTVMKCKTRICALCSSPRFTAFLFSDALAILIAKLRNLSEKLQTPTNIVFFSSKKKKILTNGWEAG